MTPELSRRLARMLYTTNPDLETRNRVVQAAEDAETFDDLPSWLQEMVRQSEGGSGKQTSESAPGPQISARHRILTEHVAFGEAAGAPPKSNRGRYKALLIRPGWGSSGYYSEAVLRRDGPKAFPAGTQNYLNHPTATERAERQARRVEDWASVQVTDAVWDQDRGGLVAEVQVFEHWRGLLNEEFAKQVGLSIRAAGTVEYGEADGRAGPIVTSLDEGISVDWVTRAGAGGKVLELIESARAGAKVSDAAWSGFSQVDYDTAQWRRACLIGPSQPSDVKGEYKLPVREPDGTLNRNAVYAAASRIGQVDAPADVKKAAARKLVGLYRQLGEDPPQPLTDLAGMAKARAKEAALTEARNVGGWLESRLHLTFTQLTDEMYGDGRLTREERIGLSSAIGDALAAFTARVETDHPQLFTRDLYVGPEAPVGSFEYGMAEGRAGTPTPALPADGGQVQKTPPAEPAAGPTDEEEDSMSTLSEGLRERLGIEDAELDEDALLAALDEALAERADNPDRTGELAEPAAAVASLPPGTVAIDEATLAELREQAAQGVAARAQQVTEARDRALDDAVKAGKFPPARREHWATLWDADPDGTRQTLAALAEGTVPLADIGEPGGLDTGASSEDAEFDRLFSSAVTIGKDA
jgi:hypothetical protein